MCVVIQGVRSSDMVRSGENVCSDTRSKEQ